MFRGAHWSCIALGLVSLPGGARAAEVPPNAADMLREAYPKERQTIVNVLKRLYPEFTRRNR